MKIINILVLKDKKDEITDIYVEYRNKIRRAYTKSRISEYFDMFSKQENKTIQELYDLDKIFDVQYSPKLMESLEELKNKFNDHESFTLKENIKAFLETFNVLVWIMTRNLIVKDYDVSYFSSLLLVLNAYLVIDSIKKASGFGLFMSKKIKKAESKLDLLRYYGLLLLMSSSLLFFKDEFKGYLHQDYYETVMDTDLDSLYSNELDDSSIRELKVEKIFNDLSNNPYLSDEDKEILYDLKKYYNNNPYLDLDELYKKMLTFKIEDYYAIGVNPEARYLKDTNTSEVYYHLDKDTSIDRSTIVLHEAIHMTGGFEYRFLNEGMTSLLEHEYFEKESLFGVDGYFFYRQCVRVLCYLVGSDTMLESYSESSQELLDSKMVEIYGSMDKVLNIYNAMDLYSNREKIDNELYPTDEEFDKQLYKLLCDGNLTEEQKLMIPNYICLMNTSEAVYPGNFFNIEENVKQLKY